MLNYLRHKKLFDELPDSYPAEIFIDFVLTQGYIVIEDTPTYTLVKNDLLKEYMKVKETYPLFK